MMPVSSALPEHEDLVLVEINTFLTAVPRAQRIKRTCSAPQIFATESCWAPAEGWACALNDGMGHDMDCPTPVPPSSSSQAGDQVDAMTTTGRTRKRPPKHIRLRAQRKSQAAITKKFSTDVIHSSSESFTLISRCF
eukprot:gnl/TRDRNA2_/TRDRNA2_33382_c0_seq2.p1 gnl/TRDRNA2_/TRDRNA2_33382_c0~~gnl/TRDRNA2_/TRDRNA2_33382_c0_seq2.p1  ORF type:complete len:137 (+),score=23.86 gnl/TRDRNA2_/TRDRNA2_33382_c0_seq2:73-483(+)